ncbi:hypothetical protein CBS101457_002397 [Exobasidium rhododendri]|nr:hypothetical protein CBS101457_002397 [Exobasidium rhododendri]
MVQATQRIWFQALRANRYMAATFFLWGILGVIAAIAYAAISLNFVLAIRRELFKEGASLHNEQHISNSHAARDDDYLQDPAATSSLDKYSMPSPPMRTINLREGTALSIEPTFDTKWPEQSPAESDTRQTSAIRSKDLRNALSSGIILPLVAIPTLLGLSTATFFTALTCYGKLEHASKEGGTQFDYYIGIIYMFLTWGLCLSGGTVTLAMGHQIFEPVITSNRLYTDLKISSRFGSRRSDSSKRIPCPPLQASFFETQSFRVPSAGRRISQLPSMSEEDIGEKPDSHGMQASVTGSNEEKCKISESGANRYHYAAAIDSVGLSNGDELETPKLACAPLPSS